MSKVEKVPCSSCTRQYPREELSCSIGGALICERCRDLTSSHDRALRERLIREGSITPRS